MKLRYRYWTKTKGIGGSLKVPEDFVVREIINPKFLRKQDGKYTLFLVKKRNITTRDAIKEMASLGLHDIGYAGLKDKFSVSWQYMSAVAEPKNYCSDNLMAVPVGKCKKIFPGDLIANAFVITLHDCSNKKNLYSVIEELFRRGMPNYFGLQRFGRNKDNHIVGKHVVKKEFADALKVINKNSRKRYSSIKDVPKALLKFFINAYQSWIFNEALNKYISHNSKPYFKYAPIFGYKTHLGNTITDNIIKQICRKESIAAKDFRINELMLSCLGSRRQAFIRLAEINYTLGTDLKIAFTLPKGSYATVLLKEVCKREV